MKYISVCSGVEAASLAWRHMGWEPVAFSEIEPFPSAVLRHRFPDVPNLGDMTRIRVQDNGDILYETGDSMEDVDDALSGTVAEKSGGMPATGVLKNVKCDLLVGGTPCFPAGTMVLTERGYRPIEELKEGDAVVTGKGRLRRILKAGSREAPTTSVLIEGRIPFRATVSHPFMAVHHGKDKAVPLSECAGLDATMFGNGFRFEAPEMPDIPDEISTGAMMTLLGRICCGENVGNSIAGEFFSVHFKEGVPFWCYGMDRRLRMAFVAGGFTAAASAGPLSWRLKFKGTSPLMLGYADIAASVGMDVSMEDGPDGVSLIVAKSSPAAGPGSPELAGLSFRKFLESPAADRTETVYNIEVEDDHTYVADGVRVHNCQSFSVAGKREGLRGASGLALDYIRLAYELAAHCGLRWLVWENVPGVFSSERGGDFAAFLSGLAGWDVATPNGGWGNAGAVANATSGNFGLAFRTLDAQYVRVEHGFPGAVPQRRRRVFVVGCLGDWERAVSVLFEDQCLFGNSPPRRKKAWQVASHTGGDAEMAEGMDDAVREEEPGGRVSGVKLSIVNGNGQANEACIPDVEVSKTLDCIADPHKVMTNVFCFQQNQRREIRLINGDGAIAGALAAEPGMSQQNYLCQTGDGCLDDRPDGGKPATGPDGRICAAFMGGQGHKAGSIAYSEHVSPTIKAAPSGTNSIPDVLVYENHSHDSRVVDAGDVSPTLTSRMGTGGNNVPLVQMVNSNGEDVMPTLNCQDLVKRMTGQADKAGMYVMHDYSMNGDPVNLSVNGENGRCVSRDPCVSVEFGGPGMTDVCVLNDQGGERMNVGYGIAPTLRSESHFHEPCVIVNCGEDVSANSVEEPGDGDYPLVIDMMGGKHQNRVGSGVSPTLVTTHRDSHAVLEWPGFMVRRLMPVETERLMGMPDNWTRIPWNGRLEEECPDGHRYKACGNSFCVNVVRWIGERIEAKAKE